MKNVREDTDQTQMLAHFTIERAADAVLWFDSEARVQRVNLAACRSLGYSREELRSMTLHDIDLNSKTESWPGQWAAIKKRNTSTYESQFRAKDGRIFPVEVSLNYIEFEGKEYTCAFARHITDRKQVEEEIKSLAKFPSENPNPVLRIAKDGTVIYANEASTPLLKTWGCQTGQTLPEKWQKYVYGVFISSKSDEIEIPCEDHVFLVLFAPIAETGYVTVYGRDITERKRAEDALRNALSEVEQLKNRLQNENAYLQEEIKTERNFDEIIGSSTSLKKVLRKVEQVAPTDATVLIHGETGTGKELLARAVHNLSLRKDRPLVKVNCGAIPPGLVESELFGHEKGAFTGALQRRIGRFELGDGGTIFLDEVGELPLDAQVRLLRVLQEQEFERVGSNRTIRVNVRVIAATNRNLVEAVQGGTFRSDLFYRLNVFPLGIPSLQERKSDIPDLVNCFLTKFAKKLGKPVPHASQETIARLMDYPWPGNIREMENVIERAVILSRGPTIEIDESIDIQIDAASPSSPTGTLQDLERAHILRVVEETRWVIEGKQGAATILGLHPNTLRFRMRKLGIKRPSLSP